MSAWKYDRRISFSAFYDMDHLRFINKSCNAIIANIDFIIISIGVLESIYPTSSRYWRQRRLLEPHCSFSGYFLSEATSEDIILPRLPMPSKDEGDALLSIFTSRVTVSLI